MKLITEKIIFLLIVSASFFISPLLFADRGLEPVPITDKQGEPVGLYKESHALVIGVSDYNNGWPVLPGVTSDVADISAALEKNRFDVRTVLNPDKDQLEQAFEEFISEYGRDANNRLLFYFAGHGHTIKPKYGGDPLGYIVPKEAPNPNLNETASRDFKSIAMSMQRIEEYALSIDSKHAIFLFDSCFSGSIFALSRAVPEYISDKTIRPVRQFITSGDADEKVPDKSIFCEQFISAIEGEADFDDDRYVTGTELGEFLQKRVVNYSKGAQHPLYGKIRNPSLDRGDFVFVLRNDAYELQESLPSGPEEIAEFSFGDIESRRKNRMESEERKLNEIKAKWARWQKKLDSAYNGAIEYDKDSYVSVGDKAQAWKLIVTVFRHDNPYSTEDEMMRSKAIERLNYWKNYKDPKQEEIEESKRKWNNWQGSMSDIYSKNYDTDEDNTLMSSKKVQMWNNFLAKYSDDNPYSTDDQMMRSRAMERLKYWENYEAQEQKREEDKKKWEKWQEKMSGIYSEKNSSDGHNSMIPSKKVYMWEQFLEMYSDDNPYSTEDQSMRSHAMERLNYWKNYDESQQEDINREWEKWQKKMSGIFSSNNDKDEDNALEPSRKVQMWDKFLAKYPDDNPNSTEDQVMRNRAMERLNYWKNYKEPPPIPEKTTVKLRSAYARLSVRQARNKKYFSVGENREWGFYGYSKIDHAYELKTINGDKVVIDHATGLMWHQSGSSSSENMKMKWRKANQWIKDFNSKGYAGYNDWRLPTVEEASSLLESSKKNGGLYIDPVFSREQSWIWTGDNYKDGGVWDVNFEDGFVHWLKFNSYHTVRPVRSYK